VVTHHGSRWLVVLLLVAATIPLPRDAHAQLPVIGAQQQLTMPPQSAPRPTDPTTFGALAVTDGRTILVTVGAGPAAYTYIKDATTGRWVYDSALVAPEGFTSTGGAVRGNVAVLQGVIAEANVVFVFLRSAGQWIHTQTLPGTGPRSRANPLALGRDYLAIGELEAGGFTGAVHIYNETGPGTYVFDSDLLAAGSSPGFLTGYHVIAHGDFVLSSAPAIGTVFARFGGVWSEEAQLPSSPYTWLSGFSGNHWFNISGGVEGGPNKPQGFVRRDGMWLFDQELTHPLNPNGQLDLAIAMDGRRLIVGDRDSESGFLFELRDGSWHATAELKQARDSACASGAHTVAYFELAGSLALSACPDRPTGHPLFDGRVLIFELPPLR
jgi:hypothetical protein